MSDIVKTTLPNGVRILVEPVGHVQSAAVGLWCRTGSRDEAPAEAGVTHLIEHMLFKGTPTRTARELAEAIEGRGGVMNAFTDKEATCYYCRVLADDASNGVDVLSDMMLNSLLDPVELDREAGVVVEEIKRSEDEPGDLVHDLHVSSRWGEHPLGRPVIGTQESVKGFRREDLVAYMGRRYRAQNVLLAVSGNVDPAAIVAAAEADLGRIAPGEPDAPLDAPASKPGLKAVAKDVEQVHFCIGTDGVDLHDEEFYALSVLDAALGGSMSSRLFQEIREKRGLVYSVGSYVASYAEAGLFTIYGGTSPKNWPEVQELVARELAAVRAGGLEPEELARTKRQLSGVMVIALEGMSARMMRMSRNELVFGREVPVAETLAKLDAVTPARVAALAERLFHPDSASVTTVGPAA